jgi:integrase
VHLEPAKDAKYGYVTVRRGHAKNSKARNVPLSGRVSEMLKGIGAQKAGLVFHRASGERLSATWLDQQNAAVRTLLKFPADFVLHSLRHTFGTRLGESGADAFTIMRLMGHSTVTVSQRYVHPSPESVERAYNRMEAMNAERLGTISGTAVADKPGEIQQVQ